jgi:hypothetical protein
MRVASLVVCALLFLQPQSPQPAAPIQVDPQAVAIVRQAITALAKTPPTDSTASGIVTVVEGSTTQSGTIQILTRGAAQTSETITLPDGQRSVVYSNGNAKEVSANGATAPPLERILTDQSPDFPLSLLLSIQNNSDEAYRYVGQEILDGTSAQHVQVWNTFSSRPPMQKLASFSTRDIWFDALSGLPLKVAYSRRTGGGSAPAFPVEVSFSSYTNVNGVSYPFQITKSFNGTAWQTITIQNVTFNTGLTDAQFPVQ